MTTTRTVQTDVEAAITLLESANRCIRKNNLRAARGYLAMAFTLIASLNAQTATEVPQ